MIMTKSGWVRFLYTIIVSIAIYLISIIIILHKPIFLEDVFKSIGLGISLWFIAENLTSFVDRIIPHSNIPSYITLIIIIGLGTRFGIYLLGISELGIIIIICLLAEISGITIALIYQHIYRLRLNQHLKSFQNNDEADKH